MVEVSGLVKKYGHKVAVNNITFKINQGETVGFLGPNGAGKTTTMNMLTGYISPDYGVVKIGGIDLGERPIEAKKLIGYLPENAPLYLDMTVNEQLSFVCRIKGIKQGDQQITQLCRLLNLDDVRRKLIKNLSKGYKQRVGLAQALLGDPQVLILDEPTIGLDPKQQIEVRNIISDYGKSHTVILSSHILSEIAAVADRILVIHQGRIAADDSSANLSRVFSEGKKLVARIEGDGGAVLQAINTIADIVSCEVSDCEESGAKDYIIESRSNLDIRRPLFDLMARHSYHILMLKPLERGLEDIFLRLTKDAPGESYNESDLHERA